MTFASFYKRELQSTQVEKFIFLMDRLERKNENFDRPISPRGISLRSAPVQRYRASRHRYDRFSRDLFEKFRKKKIPGKSIKSKRRRKPRVHVTILSLRFFYKHNPDN